MLSYPQSMSRILIVNGSPRKNGVDAAIIGEISKRLTPKGHDVEVLNICDMDIHGCIACMSCKSTGKCFRNDDMQGIYDKIRASDMLIFTTPVYFGAETGQLKTFIDRLYALTGQEKPLGNVRVSSTILVCGDPLGHLKYTPIISRMTNVFKYLRVDDFASGYVFGGLEPKDVPGNENISGYIDGLEFQLEM